MAWKWGRLVSTGTSDPGSALSGIRPKGEVAVRRYGYTTNGSSCTAKVKVNRSVSYH